MSQYAQWVADFFTRYQEPTIDDLIIGFSGIDPPLKVLASEINHEELDNLLGGEPEGHYHLTKEQWEKIIEILDGPDPIPVPEPKTEFDGGFATTSESEYAENLDYWLDGGYSQNNHDEEFDGGYAA